MPGEAKHVNRDHPPGDVPTLVLDVKPEEGRITPKDAATVSWRAQGVDELSLHSEVRHPLDPLLVDWWQLSNRSQKIAVEGEMTLTPKVTTTHTLAAIGAHGRRMASVVIDVVTEKPEPKEPITWSQWVPEFVPDILPAFLPDYFERFGRRNIACLGAGPAIRFSANPRTVFVDEEVTLTWDIECSSCATMSQRGWHTTLIADPREVEGTRFQFGGAWAADPVVCSLDMEGGRVVSGWSGPGTYNFTILAEGFDGTMVARTQRLGFLPRPRYEGCTADQRTLIERALKDIYTSLLDGCILNNRELDTEVRQFREGALSRERIWSRVIDELRNLNLITFRCEETTDAKRGGGWSDRSNTINLYWMGGSQPTTYAVFHEFIHKSGFNGRLIPRYTGAEVEEGAHRVAAACF